MSTRSYISATRPFFDLLLAWHQATMRPYRSHMRIRVKGTQPFKDSFCPYELRHACLQRVQIGNGHLLDHCEELQEEEPTELRGNQQPQRCGGFKRLEQALRPEGGGGILRKTLSSRIQTKSGGGSSLGQRNGNKKFTGPERPPMQKTFVIPFRGLGC